MLVAPILIIGLLSLIPSVYAQNVTSTTATQTPPLIDATTGTALGAGGVAGVIAVVKQVLDQRKNTARDKSTDGASGTFFVLMSKYFQAKYLYPQMTDREILDLPISNNPMSKQTLGQAITTEADKWAVGNQQYWNIPSPQMAVPTLTTVEAVKGSTAAPPPAPGNK